MTATLPNSRVPDPIDAPAITWGVLAPGSIARTFADSVVNHTRSRIGAVGSRSVERAQAFADEFGGTAYSSYDELVADPSVDVVYVASPHSEHRDHALLAIEAGKHVLVEKAFTRNVGEAREVVRAARERGVFCMEAMWSRFLPHYDVIRQAVDTGVIGEVTWINAEHGQLLYPDGPQRIWDPNLAGGGLLDIGVYPVSFAAMLMPRIDQVHAVGCLTDTGVDASEVITFIGPEHSAGRTVAALTSTITTQTPNRAVIAGTRGRIEVDGWFYFPNTVRLLNNDGDVLDEVRIDPAQSRHALEYEAAAVARHVTAGEKEATLMPLDETLRVMELMDEVRHQLGVRYPGE